MHIHLKRKVRINGRVCCVTMQFSGLIAPYNRLPRKCVTNVTLASSLVRCRERTATNQETRSLAADLFWLAGDFYERANSTVNLLTSSTNKPRRGRRGGTTPCAQCILCQGLNEERLMRNILRRSEMANSDWVARYARALSLPLRWNSWWTARAQLGFGEHELLDAQRLFDVHPKYIWI